jgi:FAD synthetase
MEEIKDAIRTHGVDRIAIAFSGGKDGLVILHLVYTALRNIKMKVLVYALNINSSPFDIYIEDAIKRSSERLSDRLTFHTIKCESFVSGLHSIVSIDPKLSAIIMGRRNDDLKNGSVLPIAELTTPPYPMLWRIYPIREWSYQSVWKYIKHHNLPYCVLYDKGYSSLGNNKESSVPNPELNGRPADELVSMGTERFGRN